MEKFSSFRDSGTGIQPFLHPVPAPSPGSEIWSRLLLPITLLVGAARTMLICILTLLYIILVEGLCNLLPYPLNQPLERAFTALAARAALFVLGFYWIRVETVTRRRGKTNKTPETWSPRHGTDVIVSNYVSWIELLWLAFRFNPRFVFPVPEDVEIEENRTHSAISYSPNRRLNTGSAQISSPSRLPKRRVPVQDSFVPLSLFAALRITGRVPPYDLNISSKPQTIDEIAKGSRRPIVVFPELTTTNGRGLARFASVFSKTVPVKDLNIFVMCVRYDPPTTLSPSLAHPIPSRSFNPLSRVFAIASSLTPPSISIRLLNPLESPSSPGFMLSDVATDLGDDQLSEVCAALIAQIGKIKRMTIGWEDKAEFLHFYRQKKK